MTDLYLQTGLALAIVIGTIMVLGKFLKKRQEKAGLMKVMGYQSLGTKKGLALVKVGHEVILVGVTSTDIKLFKTIEGMIDESECDQTPPRAEQKPVSGFSDMLQKVKSLKDNLHAD
jgi:flagellar biogenesis protein FliO